MKSRALRRDHTVIATAAGMFGLGLIAVNAVWPSAFTIFIAVGGVIGAFVVIYEVRLTKRIAQAEFIRDLQSGFAVDPNIGEIWRKLLLKEDIQAADRPMVSNYLTFFETLYILLAQGALELPLTDDLFRNRFFTAIGDKGILDTALIREAGAFTNIHHLVEIWHQYLLGARIPIHAGYYSYVKALTEAKGYEIVRLHETDLPALVDLQERVIRALDDSSWLRSNTDVMLKECLIDHISVGARWEGELVAVAILYDGGDSDESIRKSLFHDPAGCDSSVNLKVVLSLPEHRRAGLSRALVELLEREATELDKVEILCTIHPKNVPSKSLFKLLGYRRVGRIKTKYGGREVFARTLPTRSKRWAR